MNANVDNSSGRYITVNSIHVILTKTPKTESCFILAMFDYQI